MNGRQIRVLHALGSMNPGGVETWLLQVLKAIDRDRFQLDFCTFGPEPGLFAPELESLGVKMLRCPFDGNHLAFRSRFRRILREGRYDIVHSHVTLFSGAILRWAKAERVPVRIAHSHISQDDKPSTYGRRLYRALMKSWIRRYASRGLAASRPAAAALFGGDWERDGRFSVLHYGIDLTPFSASLARDKVRRDLGIPEDAIVIGHAGRFVEVKNHQFLVKIAEMILERRPKVHFLLVGDGPLRASIESEVNKMGLARNFHFAGVRTDVPRLMRGAMDVFVFPSIYEGFGITLLEAQAAGLPCLVSDTVPAETAAPGHSVEFVPLTAGPDCWAHRIEEMVVRRAQPLSSVNSEFKARFSIQRSVRELAQIYESQTKDLRTRSVVELGSDLSSSAV